MQLLIVDDESFLVENLARYLEKSIRAEIFTATSPEEALSITGRRELDLIVCDLNIGGKGEGALIRRLKEIRPGIKFIEISAMEIPGDMQDLKNDILHYFEKPFSVHEFQSELEDIITQNFQKTQVN